jgi:hypothetical protein
VFDQIIELQNTQDAIYRAALEELQRRLQFEEKKKQREPEVWLYTGAYHFSCELGSCHSGHRAADHFPAQGHKPTQKFECFKDGVAPLTITAMLKT